MLRVQVQDGVSKRDVKGKNGRDYTFYEQNALISLGSEVRHLRLSSTHEDQCVKAGVYLLDVEKSLRVNNYGDLQIAGRLALTPVVAGQK